MSGDREMSGDRALPGGAMAGRREHESASIWVPVMLALIAEASWIAVLAALLQTFVLHPPTIGIAELLLPLGVGLLAARWLEPALGDRWLPVAVLLAAACGLAGWLWSAEVREILSTQGIAGLGAALAANPGGWLAWVAFVRGMAYARPPLDPRRVGTLLAVAVPGLALAAVVGGMIAEPWRSLFLATAQADVLVFLATAIPALALSRLALVARGTTLDWRRNPAWLALVAGLVLATAAVAVIVALLAGRTIAMALWALAAPLLLVGFVIGFDRRSLKILFLSLAVAGVIGTVLGFITDRVTPSQPGSVPPPPPPVPEPATQAGVALGVFVVVVLVVAVAAVLLLASLWRRRPSSTAVADDEIREIARVEERDARHAPRRARRLRRRTEPVDAAAAYQTLLEELDGRPPVAREPGETPSEHARRLRAEGTGGLALDLLAADYGLIRFGGERLTMAEHRRALARSVALRRRLGSVPRAGTLTQDGVRHPASPIGPFVRGRGGSAGADLPDAGEPGVAATILNRIRRGP